jgi:hypothetical protein
MAWDVLTWKQQHEIRPITFMHEYAQWLMQRAAAD